MIIKHGNHILSEIVLGCREYEQALGIKFTRRILDKQWVYLLGLLFISQKCW